MDNNIDVCSKSMPGGKPKTVSEEKMEKSLKQTNTDESLGELESIKPYLPTMMGEDRIREILHDYKANGLNNVGQMMGEFNKVYKGKADNALVSKIVKEVLV